MQLTPVGPNQSYVDMYWLVHPDSLQQPGYDVQRVTEVWKATGEQDWELSVNNQRGIVNPHATVRDLMCVATAWKIRWSCSSIGT
jgi:phenylpropionate dioxygenase-like ring-hydroxylating dioxygenase large terminal subunit